VFTDVPATGLSLITSPEGTVLLDAGVTIPTMSPAPVMAVVAAVCVSFTTFGTITCVTCAGPLESTRFTDDPVFTEVPATGLSLITSPEGTVLLDAVVTVPTNSPTPVIAVDAAICVSFTTFGTCTCAGSTGSNSHRSFISPNPPVESKPNPPKSQKFPDASMNLTDPYRPPGMLLKAPVP
jgi:hypothetical protein